MTVTRYFNREQRREPEFFTVQELYDKLGMLIKEGKGSSVILLPRTDDLDYNNNADYVLADARESFKLQDIDGNGVYLEALPPDDDEYVASQLWQ